MPLPSPEVVFPGWTHHGHQCGWGPMCFSLQMGCLSGHPGFLAGRTDFLHHLVCFGGHTQGALGGSSLHDARSLGPAACYACTQPGAASHAAWPPQPASSYFTLRLTGCCEHSGPRSDGSCSSIRAWRDARVRTKVLGRGLGRKWRLWQNSCQEGTRSGPAVDIDPSGRGLGWETTQTRMGTGACEGAWAVPSPPWRDELKLRSPVESNSWAIAQVLLCVTCLSCTLLERGLRGLSPRDRGPAQGSPGLSPPSGGQQTL